MGGPGLNTTDPDAVSVHGTNPQNLVEKILRMRIYDHRYWKEHCFGLNAESLVDKACDLKYCGGAYGGMQKPSPFLCLLLKMLQIQPELDIVREFVRNDDYKYVRVLGAIYFRIVAPPVEVYTLLEPLYNDFRSLRRSRLPDRLLSYPLSLSLRRSDGRDLKSKMLLRLECLLKVISEQYKYSE